MKLNKKNKGGKVHPSPPHPLHSTDSKDAVASALKLLPAAILTLIAVLTPNEREVLAYLITRSIKATENLSLLRTTSKRTAAPSAAEHNQFDCGCFDCYTSYWFRWDSSPNRELINEAIEAFEEHLAKGERSRSSPRKSGKRRERIGEAPECSTSAETLADSPAEAAPVPPPGPAAEAVEKNEALPEPPVAARTVVACGGGGNHNHKGLARKVLPDVIGVFNSRLWSLWSPNV